MPIFASEPATTVRQRSPWLFSKPLYGAVFLAVAFTAYGWQAYHARPTPADSHEQATAKVCIHQTNFAFESAWQEIAAQAKSEVRENLRMEAQPGGQQTIVSISLSNVSAETRVPVVNLVASAYAQACRAQWKLHLEQGYSAAEEKVRQTERLAFEAQTRFELLRDRRVQALANLRPVAPQPVTVDNPRWTEISRRLADLEERRRILLFERTPLHPSVQELEMRIADVRREMASIPPKISQDLPTQSPPSVMPPGAPTLEEVQTAQQAAEQLKQDLQQAQARERTALATRSEGLQVDLIAAEPLPAAAPSRATAATLGKALVLATTSIVGLGMISLGASLEPVITSIAQLRSLLPVPIVGVIPAAHPWRRSSSSRRRYARYAWIAAGLAVLLAVAWIFFHG